jgi:hypothetical protein
MNALTELKSGNRRRRILYRYVCPALLGISAVGSLALKHKRATPHSGGKPANVPVFATHKPETPDLRIDRIIQHGHIVEIQGRVQPGTTVMVNGERAAVIWEDGEIKHFVGPLPDGVSDIAITVQNDEGGINTRQLSVSLP